MKNRTIQFMIFLLLVGALQANLFAQESTSVAVIRQILQERIDKNKKSVGMVVGIISKNGSQVVGYGKLSKDRPQEPDGNTVYEIGSITKVFTSILLQDMAERGEMNLDDPVAKYLPKFVKIPTKDGKEMTLQHLATHTSGLARMPDNFAPKNADNPYADYTVEQMYDFLSRYQLTRGIGEKYEYSNLGVGLLGHLLALKAGMDYETLVTKRICAPLKMSSTVIKLSPAMRARLAQGHNEVLRPASNWDIPTLAGAGALHSTTNDLLLFVAANLGFAKSSLTPILQKTHAPQHGTDSPNLQIALGWHILKKDSSEIIWHNGGTGGYRSFIGFDKAKDLGVVVLSNTTNDIDDIGRHLLNSKFELAKLEPTQERTAIKVDPKVYDAYVGQYELAPGIIFDVIVENNQLQVQLTGQPRFPVFAESETKFFYKVVDAQLTFQKDSNGKVTSLILHQGGIDQMAKKIKYVEN